MRIHYLQHVPFEGLGSIAAWAERKGLLLSRTRLYAGEALPAQEEFEFLIVMGGPMGVYDEGEFPWLKEEKEFLLAAIRAEKAILGICLGAQLLAAVLGAVVKGNGQQEIGWFPVSHWPEIPETIAALLPDGQRVFHWHGDTFAIPPGALPLYSSAACRNQAFLYGKRILGLQFHLETTPESLAGLIENCGADLVEAPWVQPVADMLGHGECFAGINRSMEAILDYLAGD
jgi:GMP synthase (glutamine-hydrolysing)